MKALIAGLLVLVPGVACAEPLTLICKGLVTTTETSTASSMERWNGQADHFPQRKTATISTEVSKPGQYRVVIMDGGGEVISGQDDDRVPIRELVVGEREISGRLKFGLIGTSKLVIDRQTGDIRMGDFFAGNCERGPSENTPNKF